MPSQADGVCYQCFKFLTPVTHPTPLGAPLSRGDFQTKQKHPQNRE